MREDGRRVPRTRTRLASQQRAVSRQSRRDNRSLCSRTATGCQAICHPREGLESAATSRQSISEILTGCQDAQEGDGLWPTSRQMTTDPPVLGLAARNLHCGTRGSPGTARRRGEISSGQGAAARSLAGSVRWGRPAGARTLQLGERCRPQEVWSLCSWSRAGLSGLTASVPSPSTTSTSGNLLNSLLCVRQPQARGWVRVAAAGQVFFSRRHLSRGAAVSSTGPLLVVHLSFVAPS
jgi:hypothetical protein